MLNYDRIYRLKKPLFFSDKSRCMRHLPTERHIRVNLARLGSLAVEELSPFPSFAFGTVAAAASCFLGRIAVAEKLVE